jgi:hypothetical protein
MIPPDRPVRKSFAPMQVSLSGLPPGIKIGDSIQLQVDDIDKATSMATLSADQALSHPDNEPFAAPDDDSDTPTTQDGAPAPGGNDTKVLLGPMSGLKNYLVKKSQDNQAQV